MNTQQHANKHWFADKRADLDDAFAVGRGDATSGIAEEGNWLATFERITGLRENWEAELAFWIWLRPYMWEVIDAYRAGLASLA